MRVLYREAMVNRLGSSLSPYLRQHASNPVDWYEWGDEAFAAAHERDVPILLSVGYAACHWCHVMAHESFENEQIAAQLNDRFVAIKVDREERPDIDSVYMDVTQALTGHGGWPMTVFLTPDAKPLYAGTYFRPEALTQIAASIDRIWREERDRAQDAADSIVRALAGAQQQPPTSVLDRSAEQTQQDGAAGFTHLLLHDETLTRAVRRLQYDFDDRHAGFGGAPKFPPSMTIQQLLRHHARTGDETSLDLAEATCEAMARGGLYDQLDGGFARYSVDEAWVVPHFEKMLYDNAQLLRAYAYLCRATDSALARRVATETADFMLRRLGTDEGALAASLDADADGVEGSTYIWSPAQLVAVLGEANAIRAARLLAVTPDGSFEDGYSTLRMPHDPVDVLPAKNPDPANPDGTVGADGWWAFVKDELARVREQRPQPERDDKVVTSWNGLAISALVEAAMTLERPDLLEGAQAIADFMLARHLVDGRLRRTSLGETVGDAVGLADDYGNFAEALLLLCQATGKPTYLGAAMHLLTLAEELFIDEHGVYDTAADASELFIRPKSSGDNAEPCGASSLAAAFTMAFAMTNESRYHQLALRCLDEVSRVAQDNPRFAGWALACAEALMSGPLQVAIVVPEGADTALVQDFVRAAWESTQPGQVVAVGAANLPDIPLLADRPETDGVRAYVCRGFVCDAPVDTPDALAAALAPGSH